MESLCSVTEFLSSLFSAERDIIVIRKFLKIKEYYSLVRHRLVRQATFFPSLPSPIKEYMSCGYLPIVTASLLRIKYASRGWDRRMLICSCSASTNMATVMISFWEGDH